ncbi:MAG TPA: S9 family peptidase [Actinomycetota bacterium]|jgi:dipeptidyl aminopeptidase/acylaminoacyl peptidase|nr:S9 family peptidase [Actinomycetota bacterium]
MPEIAPYGSWRSPITAAAIARGGIGLSGLHLSGRNVFWSELRPAEGGRTVVLRNGKELTPKEFNARTAVHEYGGGAWWVHGDTVFFTNWTDQRLYRQDPGAQPVAITPEPPIARGLRYADGEMTSDGSTILCVRERHVAEREAFNEIVVLPADGSSEPRIVVEGNDFYSFPRLSPDGSKLAWTEWTHPNLPWDGSFLYVADYSDGRIGERVLVAGAMDESIFQPEWSPDGVLHFVSDRTGWWNLYRHDGTKTQPVLAADADFGVAQWVFGMSTYAFLPDGDVVCAVDRNARQTLSVLSKGTLTDLGLPFVGVGDLSVSGDDAWFIGATETEPQSVVRLDLHSRSFEVVKRSRDDAVDERYISRAEAIEFPSNGRTAHAFFYAPRNEDFVGAEGEKPPLLVFSHGGPTAAVRPALNLTIQFWTSRGFAVVDVNYGGSTGYGRDYRRLLNGNWGVVDVEDSVNAAKYLVERGDVDPERLAIRGGSAGGFTTLACLTFTDVFKAGANYFGVADFETFVGDTHKFESRYLDSLVGPYPERKDLYYERSPANFVDRISVPVITLQGLEDAIVPPSQSEQIVNALRKKKIPCAYVTYEGEQHGFRKAENMIHSLESELYFYGRVFGFDPADEIEPVEIDNL